jgi:hypothetical protein
MNSFLNSNFLNICRLLVLLTIKQGLSKIQKQIKKIMLLMPPTCNSSPPASRRNTLDKKQVRRRFVAQSADYLGQPGSSNHGSYPANLGNYLPPSSGNYLTGSYLASPCSYLVEAGSYLAGPCSYVTGSCYLARPGGSHLVGTSSSYLGGGGGGSYLARSRDYLTRSLSSYLGWPADQLEVVEEAYLLVDMS